MNASLLKARQTKYVAYATVYILVVIAIVAVANVLADRYNKTYDGTANKRYSLSEQTAKIVKGLKQDAIITYFDQSTRFQSAKDLLEQYQNLSPKIHVDYVDPDKKPDIARADAIKNYGTALVQIGAKKEEAKSMTEEGITGAFIRDLKNNTRTVCFVTGSGEHQIDNSDRSGYSRFKDLLGKDEYTAKSVSLLEKAEIPSDCTVIVIGGPSGDYQQPEVDAIKKYVENGGRALVMLDPPLKVGRSEVADNDALTNLLQSWGVTVDKDLILDLNPIGQLAGLG
ncbi:MAG TPA: GldG family protein, partial [Terriglobales bacterium]|nr:GldG family protein [Terriglobales bacterium]